MRRVCLPMQAGEAGLALEGHSFGGEGLALEGHSFGGEGKVASLDLGVIN